MSFLGESRLEKDIVKDLSYIFYQKDPSSPIQYVKVENLNIIFDQDSDTIQSDQNFVLLYSVQGIMFNPLKIEYKPTNMYFDCLKFLNNQEVTSYPLIVIPIHNIQKAAWKFTKKHPQINKVYAEELSIRAIDNLPISSCSSLILTPMLDTRRVEEISLELKNRYEETSFKIYEAVSKISPGTSISLSLEIYKSISSLKNIIELVASINLIKLSIYIKSYEYDKNQEDHIFLTKLLKTCKTLRSFKFNGYRFNNLDEGKLVKAKKLIDQYYIEESLMNYAPSDVWDIADF